MLDPTALTTIERARLYIRRVPNQDDIDNLLEMLINAYSDAIIRYTQRQFLAEAATTKQFRYGGLGTLDLNPYELRTVTSIVAYTDWPTAQQVTLNPGDTVVRADYILEPPQRTTEGTYLWMTLPATAYGTPSQVAVAGDWGTGFVPSSVELACLIAVANGYRNPESFASRSIGELTFTEAAEPSDDAAKSLPSDARALLSPFRRISI